MASGQVSIIPASGDSSGKFEQIAITATSSGGANVLHTTDTAVVVDSTGASVYKFVDYISIEAVNVSTVARTLTILWGDTASPQAEIIVQMGPQLPPVSIVDRRPLQGGAIVRAYADDGTSINVYVQIERFQAA